MVLMEMDRLMDRMGSVPFLPVKRTVTIGVMLYFDGDGDGHGDGDGTCKQALSPKQVYQWPIKRTCVHQKFKRKDLQLNHVTTMEEDDQVFLSLIQFASRSILN